MNRRAVVLAGVAAVILVLVATGIYVLHGKEYVYRISEQELREQLSARLPLTKAYLLIFEVTLEHPRLLLAAGSNRINAITLLDNHHVAAVNRLCRR